MRLFLALSLLCIAFLSHANEVQLIKAVSGVGVYQMSYQDIAMTFRVKHFEGERKLLVRVRNLLTNEWMDLQAHFLERLNDEDELWTLNTSILYSPADLAFYAEYHAQRGRFTDDNQGRLYTLRANEGVFLNEELVASLFSSSFQASDVNASRLYMSFQIAVRNIAYAKNVTIHLTRDDWRNTIDLDAQYQPEWNYTRGSIQSPNAYGIEMWDFHGYSKEVFYPGEEIRYYISYTVNGQTYFDNNFGKDYSYVIPSMRH